MSHDSTSGELGASLINTDLSSFQLSLLAYEGAHSEIKTVLLKNTQGILRKTNQNTLEMIDCANQAVAQDHDIKLDGTRIGLLAFAPAQKGVLRLSGTGSFRGDNSLIIDSIRDPTEEVISWLGAMPEDSMHTSNVVETPMGNVLGAREMEHLLQANTYVLSGYSNLEERENSHHVMITIHHVLPGTLMAAHETLILFPLNRGHGLISAPAKSSRKIPMSMLVIDSLHGDILSIRGEAQTLQRPEHAERFEEGDFVVAMKVLAFNWSLPSWPLCHPEMETNQVGRNPDWLVTPAIQTYRRQRVVSVNVSQPKRIEYKGKDIWTGFFKEPVPHRVKLGRLNLDGDGQGDRWGHGGVFKAAYVYPIEYYDYWAQRLGRQDFHYGYFGENLTIEGMLDDLVHIGDVYRIGRSVVEVSQPRVPCFKLAIRMGIDGFQNTFLQANRVGCYLRVLEEGDVGAGDEVELIHRVPNSLSISDVMRIYYVDRDDMKGARDAFELPALAHGWKDSLEQRLRKANALD